MKSKLYETDELKTMENVLKILESMFFSMPIPEEIMDKYNYLKESKFKRVGLEVAPITKLQYPSIGTAPKTGGFPDPSKQAEIDECVAVLYEDQYSYFEGILNHILSRCGNLLEGLKDPLKSPYSYKASSASFTIAINEVKSKIMRGLKEYQIRRGNSAHVTASIIERSMPLKITELTNKSVSELGSQMLYKLEALQGKLFSIIGSIEEELGTHNDKIRSLKNDLSLATENAKIKEANLLSEVDLLRKQLTKIENSVRSEDLKANRRYDEIVLRLKEEHGIEINRLQDSHQRAIKELNELHFSELKSLEGKLLHTSTSSKKLDEVNEYASRLENVMRVMREKLKEYYDKQRPLQTSWKDEDSKTDVEEILYTEFALYNAVKFSNDNKWLVERLAEFGKENEQLKEKLSKSLTVSNPQIIKDLMAETHNSQAVIQKYRETHASLMRELTKGKEEDLRYTTSKPS